MRAHLVGQVIVQVKEPGVVRAERLEQVLGGAPAIEDKELGPIGFVAFLEQLELCLAVDEHRHPP